MTKKSVDMSEDKDEEDQNSQSPDWVAPLTYVLIM